MMLQYKYGFISTIRNKSQLFWSLFFPVLLGTLFFFAFGSITENTESFSKIPAAVVLEENDTSAKSFKDVLEGLSDGEDPLISPRYTDSKEAEELLKEEKVAGIFYYKENKIRLVVAEEGINQSILKMVSDNYLQTANMVGTVSETRPDKIEQILTDISETVAVNQEITLAKGETDTFINYYYALMAMACLYGSFLGLHMVIDIQANMSALAARRSVSPVRKITMIISDWGAAITIQFIQILIVIAYLAFVLDINFGEQWGFVILTCFVGCITGVSYGTCVAALMKANSNTKEGFLTVSTLVLCFFSGLMVGNMKDIVEQHTPVINRINPAALLTDAFYCLTVYDNYARYTRNILSMLVISAIFCVVSAFILGRKRYASI